MLAGRSNGVMVSLVHMPVRSGSPQGVRDAPEPTEGGPCAFTESRTTATSTATHAAAPPRRIQSLISLLADQPSAGGLPVFEISGTVVDVGCSGVALLGSIRVTV